MAVNGGDGPSLEIIEGIGVDFRGFGGVSIGDFAGLGCVNDMEELAWHVGRRTVFLVSIAAEIINFTHQQKMPGYYNNKTECIFISILLYADNLIV